jgi:hypothetical protein
MTCHILTQSINQTHSIAISSDREETIVDTGRMPSPRQADMTRAPSRAAQWEDDCQSASKPICLKTDTRRSTTHSRIKANGHRPRIQEKAPLKPVLDPVADN